MSGSRRELSTIPLSHSDMARLARAGYCNIEDMEGVSLTDLRKDVGLSKEEASLILETVSFVCSAPRLLEFLFVWNTVIGSEFVLFLSFNKVRVASGLQSNATLSYNGLNGSQARRLRPIVTFCQVTLTFSLDLLYRINILI